VDCGQSAGRTLPHLGRTAQRPRRLPRRRQDPGVESGRGPRPPDPVVGRVEAGLARGPVECRRAAGQPRGITSSGRCSVR